MEQASKPVIVVIEDDDSVRESLKLSLQVLGYAVDAYPNGKLGIRAVKKSTPNAIIVDYSLPDMNGIEILQTIRRHTGLARIPVLLLTAYEKEGFEQIALAEGFVDFLRKPYAITDLKRALELLIRYQKSADLLESGVTRKARALSKTVQEKYNLTSREFEVVSLLYKGLSTEEIIEMMHIKRNTHKNHMSRILRKVNVKNQTELLQACYTLG